MPTFNAGNARKAQTAEIDTLSDTLADGIEHLLDKLSHTESVEFLKALVAVVDAHAYGKPIPANALALGAGTSSAPQSSTPPAPSGTSTSADSARTIQVEDEVRSFVTVNGGTVANTSVPGQIDVAKSLASTKDAFTADKDTAVNAAKAAPSDSIKKSDVKTKLDVIKSKADDLSTSRFSADVDGKSELDAAIADAETILA